MSSVFPLVWILFFLIEEGFALAQRTKGKLHLGFSLGMFAFSQNTSFNKASVLHKTPWICINPESKSFLTSSLPFSFFLHSWASSHWSTTSITNLFVFSAFLLQDSPIEHGGQSPNQNDCGTWVRNINGGVFTSPNYPTTYPPNKECVYILEGTANFLPPLATSSPLKTLFFL